MEKVNFKLRFPLVLSFFIIISLNFSNSSNDCLQLSLFDNQSDAKCLDGSQYGIYFSPGNNSGDKNILISFWGGGWCAGRDKNAFLSDCLERSKTALGSSKDWAICPIGTGFLSSDPVKNPNFYNWNRFDVPYCDGSGHQGHVSEPIVHQGKPLYFRGHKNTLAALDLIFRKFNPINIKTIAITGCSAGGLATFYWSQYIADKVKIINPRIQVYGFPDSGFFVDYTNLKTNDKDYSLKQKILYEVVNQEIRPENKECLNDNPNNEYKCLLAENISKYIKIPFMILQPGYDMWQLENILGISCSNSYSLKTCDESLKLIAHSYKNYHNGLIKNLASKQNLSAWSISCLTHCFGEIIESLNWEIPENSGNTINKVVRDFLESQGLQNLLIDNDDWPLNKKCSNNLLKQIKK